MIAQSLSSVMSSPSSHKPHCSWAVGSHKDQHRPSAVHTASSDAGLANPSTMSLDMTKERIRKLFTNVELSVSSYDTAWVAMVKYPRVVARRVSCIVALKRWNVGEDQINKGLSFIESNISSAADQNQPSPFAFDIIFPSMIEYAKELNIKLPLQQIDLSLMLHERESQLTRTKAINE
uniref:Ent-kaur-16-ene synthase, chloroplastic-like n=1 Tax=Tanacetum cinerariifolium TaxID=118510 RepID=A0A6L2LVN3_TANCI|nr:ent-kaur-16-ene synthase, chloroplastic-like [Tanacetum cinerariifolium]